MSFVCGDSVEFCAASHIPASVLSLLELDNVEGISVDWIGNNLYWTNDGYRKTISVARLERASQTRKTLLEGNMSHPRAIVVDPLNRSGKKKKSWYCTVGRKEIPLKSCCQC